jgi:replicative DNA helicase
MKKKVVIQSEMNNLHHERIERIVIGSVLVDPELLHNSIQDFQPKLFNDPANKIIAETIIKLYVTGSKVDLLTLTNQLMKDLQLENVGGAIYISSLTNEVYAIANFEVYIRLLQEFWLAQYINECCSQTQLDLIEFSKDVFDIYGEIQNKLDNALKDLIRQKVSSINEIHFNLIKKGYEILDGKIDSCGVKTGLTRLDILTNGFQPTDLIILAGRSGMGKTAFALSILIEPSVKQKVPVAFFSLEMSKEQVVSRIQSILSQVNVSKIVKKQLTYEEVNHVHSMCSDLQDTPLFIDDTPNISLLELKSKARKLVRENGVKMILIDYLQLMRSGIKASSREQEVAEISKGLKAIAKELQIPVIALSQLSRNVEQRGGDKKPLLSDLRDSGQIEQDADMVLFCFRPEYYGSNEYDWFGENLSAQDLFMLIVAKHRNGVLGEIPLNFHKSFTQICDHRDNFSLYSDNKNNSSNNPEVSKINSAIIPKEAKIRGNISPINYHFQDVENSALNPKNSNFEDDSSGWFFPSNNNLGNNSEDQSLF